MDERRFTLAASVVLLTLLLLIGRLIYVLPSCHNTFGYPQKSTATSRSVLILLGSGGHTGEMIRILRQFEHFDRLKRQYAVADSDETSLASISSLEKSPSVITIPRARNVGEGKLSAFFRSSKAFISTFLLFSSMKQYPDVFLCNGPGTAIPIAYVLFFFKYLGLCRTKIVYVESLARVNNLSLTGKLILPIADRILVQWSQLARRYKRCEYYGILV
ncbi:hypothetical protein KL930_002516 [Ogataea haglerorum]|uniref:UDP-N-acetylglucosamine transferase subunit ALG14 n=1 Tax=Ogataea haglerorum TaxID=1937702 RepID=A0AAN6I2B9_9ASCO|nr:uncharacterized protein KL911_002181 [Ogataea haglerorum]KAG7697034.1 hypothetical protein KL915_002297 [Ogataea haglerorum]KAG7697278.1 hypothetical protein KL951_002640 [Ogataea haglerorum]KAG7707704.1 hypothetical protein KL914_002525 [Ogataea haglerorum]KAG7709741.1 hypothetical protein KL950_001960 [Ogataea haglerorum]KAG7719819.1 hypothetical protein KL913_001788 [Ogataea haglerorum]